MVRWTARVWGVLVFVVALAGTAGSALACWNCSIWGCVADLVGFNFCRTVIVFGQPTCVASGLCPPYPFGSGGASDDFAKLKRPIPTSDPVAEVERGEVTVFGLTLPCARGCRVFEPGQTSRLLRGVAAAGDAHAMLGALVRTMADPDPDLRIAAAEVSVGSGAYQGAFAGKDGNGYGVRVTRSRGGVAMTLCAIEAGMPGRALAAETLGSEDVLLVRMWLEDQECCVVFGAMAAGLADEPTPVSAAERRHAFVEESRILTHWSRHPGFQLDALETAALGCR